MSRQMMFLYFWTIAVILWTTQGCTAQVCDLPSQWLEEPPCWARQAEERTVATYEHFYGDLTESERECVAGYKFAVLPNEVWLNDFGFERGVVGYHFSDNTIYIRECRPERDPANCYSTHASIHRHEVMHGIIQCIGGPGNADHSNPAFNALNLLEPPVSIQCEDMDSSYCDLPGRSCR